MKHQENEKMFLRNDEKQIDKLKLVSEGLDVVGVRVKK